MVKNENNSVVFLLTSTSPPYHRDALDLMFYPSQIDYRFRYDEKWLSHELKSDNGRISKEEVQKLVGKKALIIHILTEEKYKILEFLPIREATIHEVKILGEFLWLSFILRDWIVYQEKAVEGKVNEYHELLKEKIPKNSRNTINQLVFLVKKFGIETIPDDPTGENDDVLSNWTLIAGHMSRVGLRASKKALIFMKLVSLKNIDSKKALCGKILDSNQRGFELESDKSYSLEIAEYCTVDIKPFEIELKTEMDRIMPTLGKTEVRGKYDRLYFIINCRPTDKESLSTIIFEPSDSEEYLISKALLMIKIKTRKWRNLWLPLLLFGVSTFATSDQILLFLAGQTFNYGILFVSGLGTIISTISLLLLKK